MTWLTIPSFLVTVGVLVVFHEFGHYLVARLMGVKILRFSVGFGKALVVRRTGADQTEWVLSAIPLGGYVKMLDSREGEVRPAERDRAFDHKSVAARIAIVLAGPFANFLLAILLYWVLFVTGLPGMKAILADPPANTPAAVAGLSSGDTLVAIADEPVASWNDARWILLKQAVKRETTKIEIETERGAHVTKSLDMSTLAKDDLDKDFFGKLGLVTMQPRVPAHLGKVVPGKAGERAGLAVEPLDKRRVAAELRQHDLERDEPVELLLPRLVNHAHPTLAEHLENFELRE